MQDDDHKGPEPRSYTLRAAILRATECTKAVCRNYGYCQTPQTCNVTCHAGKDGECSWKECPQHRDKEPETTGRHCPRDHHDDRPWYENR